VADVATIFNIFLMLQTLIFDVMDVEFSMLQICDVGCCVEGSGRREDGP
jgi:hypothetical protein